MKCKPPNRMDDLVVEEVAHDPVKCLLLWNDMVMRGVKVNPMPRTHAETRVAILAVYEELKARENVQ